MVIRNLRCSLEQWVDACGTWDDHSEAGVITGFFRWETLSLGDCVYMYIKTWFY